MCKILTTTYLCNHIITAYNRCPLNPGPPSPPSKSLSSRPSQEMLDSINSFSFPRQNPYRKTKQEPLSSKTNSKTPERTKQAKKKTGWTAPPNTPVDRTPSPQSQFSPTTPETEKQKRGENGHEQGHAVKPLSPIPPTQAEPEPIRPLESCDDYEGERSTRSMYFCEECKKLERLNEAVEKVGINESSSRRVSRDEELEGGNEKETLDWLNVEECLLPY